MSVVSTNKMGAVVFMRMEDYERFLRRFDAPPSPADGRWSHLRVFDGEDTFMDLTIRVDTGGQTLTVASRTARMLGQDLLLAVRVSHWGALRGPQRDILVAAGIEREDARDLITKHPVEGWFDPTNPDQLRLAFEEWVGLAHPSALILTRATLEHKHMAGRFVLRSMPPSMRLATPVVVITELVADDFNRVLREHGIPALGMGSVSVLVSDEKVREWHRTARADGAERPLTAAVGSALSWVGEQLDEAHSAASSLLAEDEPDDVAALRADLAESETRERALAVQLANARAEAKQVSGQRWLLDRELQLLRAKGATQIAHRAVPETPVPRTAPDPWSHLPALTDATFSSMLPRANEVFSHLVFDSAIGKAVQSLDSHPKRGIWLLRAWSALALLDGYADAKASGDPSGTFRGWLDSRPQHPVIHSAHVRAGETLSIRGGKYGEARTFVVPTSVDPSGRAMFLTHVHIEPGRVRPNPRLHFYDDTAPGASGRIYVGHLGPHLTTRRTN